MAQIAIARGPRELESRLLTDLDRHLDAARLDPALLSRPIRIIVPSKSLKDHLAARIVALRPRGDGQIAARPALGIEIQTAHGLALSLLDDAGAPTPGGASLLPVLIRRCAARDPRLERELGGLVDGFAPAVRSVEDLLNAGLDESNAEAVLERIAGELERKDVAEWSRAQALVEVALATRREVATHGLESQADAMARATEWLAGDPAGRLDCRAVLVHGFADATGITADFLEAVLRHPRACLYLDRPMDPAVPGVEELGCVFSDPFTARMGATAEVDAALRELETGAVAREPQSGASHPAPDRETFDALGAWSEAKEVAVRVGRLLDAGATPESIGVVCRELPKRLLPLRAAFARLGIPFSSPGAVGPVDAAGRRLTALLDILRRGGDVPAGRWLDAGQLGGAGWRLHLALSALGAARLHDVADLDFEPLLDTRGRLPLPMRRGLSTVEDADGEERVVATRASIARDRLDALKAAASVLRSNLDEWPDRAPLSEHRQRLLGIAERGLRWADDAAGRVALVRLERMGEGIPDHVELGRDEFALLLADHASASSRPAAGGRGGGIRLMGVTEARAQTHEHLFVLGLNRGLFPRNVVEDPLLPDVVRAALRPILPELAPKQVGHDEERFLFAQLVESADHITLSWLKRDDDGKLTPLSPLVQRLLFGRQPEALTAPSLLSLRAPKPGDRVTATDRARQRALDGDRDGLEALLPQVLRESAEEGAPQPRVPSEWAAVRRRLVDEIDPAWDEPADLGPWLGSVGRTGATADPRNSRLFVSGLENLAACPWQNLLARLLRIEALADPLDTLPGLNAMHLGNVVHRCIESIVVAALGADDEDGRPGSAGSLARLLAGDGVRVTWPADADMRELIERVSAEVLREDGLPLPGLIQALAVRAAPYLERARELGFVDGGLVALGSELRGSAQISDIHGKERRIHFKADLVELRDGTVRLIDYKTGAPIAPRVRPATKRAKFLTEVEAGKRLQAPLYLLAAEQAQENTASPLRSVEGSFVFVRPDLDAADAESVLHNGDKDFLDALRGVAATALEASDLGQLFPRLVDPKRHDEPRRCQSCELSEACLRGDSTSRRRLIEFAESLKRRQDEGKELSEDESAMLQLWARGVDS